MVNNLFDLTGKVALVTGATHGLGMSMAIGLASCGAKIVVNDINAERLASAKAAYAQAGYTISTYIFDVTNEKQVIEGLAIIAKEVGPIDILINNAGIIKRIPAVDMDVEDFRQVIDIDLVGPFILSKHVAKSMISRNAGGKIINMCSMMSELGRETVSAY